MNENINQEVLKELQGLRRINQRIFVVVLILAIIGVIWIPIRSRQKSRETQSWDSVNAAFRRRDNQEALTIAQTIVARNPADYYGHSYLGAIYLAINDITNAQAQYVLAYELFPNEENEKNVAAIRKRIAAAGPIPLISK